MGPEAHGDQVQEPPADAGHAAPDTVDSSALGQSDVSGNGGDQVQEPPAEAGHAAPDTVDSSALGQSDVSGNDGTTPSAEELFCVLRAVARGHSGDEAYSSVIIDPPRADGTGQGVRAGLVGFALGSGQLGKVLQLMAARDPAEFAATFGPDAQALVATATADTRDDRLAPGGGARLWEPPWVDRFRAAGEVATYRYAQHEYGIEHQIRPLLEVAARAGCSGLEGIALVYELTLALGERALARVDQILSDLAATAGLQGERRDAA
jgi:hypothetical protein